jgi:predicted RNA-binding protein with PIN domain
MAANRIWIMDGHNMIFAIPPLQRLQVTDRREEARAGLADRLERFAISRGEKVLVVFDGNELPSNPDALRSPVFEAVYTRRGEGVADDRILREAGRCLGQGLGVTVVTDDVHTLASKLPRGVRHLGVREFWLKHIEKDVGEGGKRVEGDFSDVEREMMARAAMAEPAFEVRASVPRPRATGEEARRERILRKRERGRLRQERRLERHAKPGPRR